jgi:TRAP-type C4-dicarboxylate transport system permease small subunit
VSAPAQPGRWQPLQMLLELTSLLVLPLALLLFAQWPLRDWVQAGSLLANDTAQILFAFYVAVGITAASRAGAHLAAPRKGRAATRSAKIWRAGLMLLCLGPWTLFMIWSAAPLIANSVRNLDRFGETLTPGYFLIKVALGLLLALGLIDAVLAWRTARRAP